MKTGRRNTPQASSLLGFTGLLAPTEPYSEETATKSPSWRAAPRIAQMKRDSQDMRKLTRRDFVKTAGMGTAALTVLAAAETEAQEGPPRWDSEADVVVVGSGAAGMPAAIEAKENGASVIMIEANSDVGGHAILSGGAVPLGGGTSRQKKYGIEDSPDNVFRDLTDWSVIERNGSPDYRYNDKEIVRAFADNSAPTFEWLVAHGVVFFERPPDAASGASVGNSAPRENHVDPADWPQIQKGEPVKPEVATRGHDGGIGFTRPLEAAARKAGVQILLNHRMTGLVREQPSSGRVLGIRATSEGKTLNIRANRGVVVATGGSSSNVNFRRIYDTRLTEEYMVGGEPYSFQDASGELAAIAVGASLWGTFNAGGEFGIRVVKAARIGCQYGYGNLVWMPKSPVFHLCRASGLTVRDYQNVILVNQLGLRFYDEAQGGYSANDYGSIKPYEQGSYWNVANNKYQSQGFLDAALAGTGEAVNGGGPIWAIFDANAVKREQWIVEPPFVDKGAGYFFTADTLPALAAAIVNKYQRKPMAAAGLERTVARYNSFVDSGKDEDFAKSSLTYKIDTPPFYAAWATPIVHDTRAGLRINAKCQVVDFSGKVIPGLYCGGESAGGFSQHGLARCSVQGRIAGKNVAIEAP
jgi:succinate dehydrogenase/fumarate reductase flavoprotein subunit